ncbi:MAG: Do family serine endopeptidase [Bacteroidia bacterium]|nr:MAG: Do family serine endopeptidase [Bacteroidia bacterium]
MRARRFLGMLAVAVLGAFVAIVVYARLFNTDIAVVEVPVESKMQYVNMPIAGGGEMMDFTDAVEQSIDAVVHVKTKEFREYAVNPLYEFFFGDQPSGDPPPILGFGSGVIISGKGYIVTNNHVIQGSDEVLVVLNDKREFNATVIGADPSTDIALLKVDAGDLTALKFGNSDALKLGEWVLAIGNPYNLTSTVTAGIVSAKARGEMGIMRGQEFGIESFIQTDAAVNPGNSGGALINTRGELVGINSAIMSRTGAFAGYSFAVPASIVEKVVTDLIEYGEVQRAILGVNIATVTAELAEEMKIDVIEGVYVTNVRPEGAAREAGIKEGDVIISIDETRVNSSPELQEFVSKYRPGKEVKVVVKRDGKLKQFNVVLRNLEGSTEIVQKTDVIEVLGASFEPITDREKQALGISSGVKVKSVKPGKFMKVGIKEGFVLTSVNKKPVGSVKDITDILKNSEGGIIIEGVDQNGSRSYYAFGM